MAELLIAFHFLCQKTETSSTFVFLGSWLPFFKILEILKLSHSEKVLDYVLNPNPVFNSKEMQLEEDDRGYFEDESKWACRYCLWEEKSECTSESLLPDPGSRLNSIYSSSYSAALLMLSNEHLHLTSHSWYLLLIWPLLLMTLIVKQIEAED